MEDNDEQPANAPLPIDVTLFGMVTEVNPVQPLNALESIDVTLLPKTMFVS